MGKKTVLWLTNRGRRHQQAVLAAAPSELDVTILRNASRREILAHLSQAHFLVSEREGEIDAEMMVAGQNLQLIQRLGSRGYDIDLEAARAVGVPVSVLPIRGCILVAEHLLLQILALLKRINQTTAAALRTADWGKTSKRTDENTFCYNWTSRRGIRGLVNQTVGILGFGEIGFELARRLRSFSPAQVLYHKRRRLQAHTEEDLKVAYASIDQIVVESDILCNLLPYSPQTDMLLNSDLLGLMRPDALLVSCGSGSVIDEAALAQLLRDGHLAGAALDTYEWEPIRPDNPLLALTRNPDMNLLLTPHVAFGTDAINRSGDFENIRRLLRGEQVL